MRFAAQQPGIAQFLTSGPDYGGISDLGMQARSKERQTGYQAEANIRVNALDAMAKIKAAKHEAKGIIAGGQAQAAATQAQGLSSMFSNIAYGAARFKKPGGGGADKYGFDPFGSQGNPLGFGGSMPLNC